jgi:hypothetical protein
VYFGSQKYTDDFIRLGGLGAVDKKLSSGAIQWPIEKQRIFLAAFIRGDGHVSQRSWSEDDARKTRRVYVVTHSKQLANQLYVMFDRCRVPVMFNTSLSASGPQGVGRGEKRFKHYQLHFNGWSWDGLGRAPHSNSRVLVEANSIVSRLNSVEIVKYDGFVHNISVMESQSYIANRIAVHNCACKLKPVARQDEKLDFTGEAVDVAPFGEETGGDNAPLDLSEAPTEPPAGGEEPAPAPVEETSEKKPYDPESGEELPEKKPYDPESGEELPQKPSGYDPESGEELPEKENL